MNLESFRNDVIELLKSIERKIAHPSVALDSRFRELESSLITSQYKFNELTQEIEKLEAQLAEYKLAGQPLDGVEEELGGRFRDADLLKHSIIEMGNELERLESKKRY